MPERLKELPTKEITVQPHTGVPFERNQHINLDKKLHKSDRTKGYIQEAKKKLQPLQAEKPLSQREKQLANGFSQSTDKFQNSVERGFFARVPDKIKPSNLDLIAGDNANAVYILNKGTDGEGFYKPRNGEDHLLRKGVINDNFAGREVMAYELSKMLGADGLVPPTKM